MVCMIITVCLFCLVFPGTRNQISHHLYFGRRHENKIIRFLDILIFVKRIY